MGACCVLCVGCCLVSDGAASSEAGVASSGVGAVRPALAVPAQPKAADNRHVLTVDVSN